MCPDTCSWVDTLRCWLRDEVEHASLGLTDWTASHAISTVLALATSHGYQAKRCTVHVPDVHVQYHLRPTNALHVCWAAQRLGGERASNVDSALEAVETPLESPLHWRGCRLSLAPVCARRRTGSGPHFRVVPIVKLRFEHATQSGDPRHPTGNGPQVVSVAFMITRGMRQQLVDAGFPPSAISTLQPAVAQKIIADKLSFAQFEEQQKQQQVQEAAERAKQALKQEQEQQNQQSVALVAADETQDTQQQQQESAPSAALVVQQETIVEDGDWNKSK
ncbi:unnamed protein product [Phytophthora fragariaefolia]|uniref:Unnamed protein product n=1 Tax=Phytophthora fragariaefolia TaxID=1490495 RepID=A0A9W7D6F2_9STRA|nr:unnamed protein product [Phytophthora fragariaefolia]